MANSEAQNDRFKLQFSNRALTQWPARMVVALDGFSGIVGFPTSLGAAMNNVSFLSVVTKYKFAKVGDISLAGNQIRFKLGKPNKECGFVYLWVECKAQQHCVVYVGMAGKTLKARCDQHQHGFVNSPTGKKHSCRFRTGIKAKKRYEIYARKSNLGKVLDESGISMVCAEELAFIKKFSPPWNKAMPTTCATERPLE